MDKIEKISQQEMEELATVQGKSAEAYQKMAQLTRVAEKAVQEAKVAELEYKLLQQEFHGAVKQLFIVNKLDAQCKIDLNTGNVSWPAEVVEPVVAEVIEAPVAEPVKPAKKTKKGQK